MKNFLKAIIFSCCFIAAFTTQAQVADATIADSTQNKDSFVVSMFEKYTENLNYFTVAALMTVESSFIPFPSEIVVPPAAFKACDENYPALYKTDNEFINISLVVLFATIGAMLGALINYFIAYFLGRPFIYWFVDTRLGKMFLLSPEKVQKAEDYFVKNGNISTFVGRLIPGIRQLISIPAGLAKMNLAPFLLYTFLGAGIWNVVLAAMGYFAHGSKELISEYAHLLSYTFLVLGVLFIGYMVYKGFKTNNPKK